MNTNQSLQNKIDNAKELDFGNILNRTFDLYKKTWSQGFILILLGVLVITPFIVLVFMPTYLSMVEQAASGDYDYSTPNYFRQSQPESFRYMELGLTFFISFITTGLLAGFYRIIKRIDFGESYKFLDFLYFFKMKNLGKMFAIASFSFLIALINFDFEKFLPPLSASLLSGALSIILSVYTALFVVFFAYNTQLESSDFFMLSFKLGSKKWFLIFSLMFVTIIIAALGILLCFIGLLFTLSIVYLPIYLVYKDVIGFDDLSVIDEIGTT